MIFSLLLLTLLLLLLSSLSLLIFFLLWNLLIWNAGQSAFLEGPYIHILLESNVKNMCNKVSDHSFLRLKLFLLHNWLSALSRIVQYSMPYNKITKPFSKDYYVSSFCILKNNLLVFEDYFHMSFSSSVWTILVF